MRCERAQELFSDFYDGTMPNALVVPLQSHLDACPDCQAQVADLRDIWRILDAAPVVEPPADFRAAVWQRIDAEEEKRRRTRRPLFAFSWRALFTRPALGWAAAVLLVVVLAGVVVPGRYTAARMMFPWNLFYAPSAPQALTVGAPSLLPASRGAIVSLPVVNPSDQSVVVHTRVIDGPAYLIGYQVSTEAAPRTRHNAVVLFTYMSEAGDPPLRLRISWEQNGQKTTRDYSPQARPD